MQFNVLIIDDEEIQLQSLKTFLSKRKFNVFTSRSGEDGIRLINENLIDIVLTDFKMPGMNGFEVLRKTKEINPGIDVVVMTAFGTIENAVSLMKAGAFDYLIKPIDLDELENILEKITERKQLISENKLLRSQLKEKYSFSGIISQSAVMEEVLNKAGREAQ